MNSNYSNPADLHYFNINKLVNLYKDNNELISDIITSSTFTRENFIFTQDNLKTVIDEILVSNRNICNSIVNIINNPQTQSQNTPNTFAYRNRSGTRNSSRDRNAFRDDRININSLPYYIDSIERYSLQMPVSPIANIQNFFEPVEVYPTQSQIENSTRIVKYGDILRPLNTSCPISLERFNDSDYVTIIRYCTHIFNTNGLNNWFRTNCRCPVCRYDIRNYNPSNNLNEIYNANTNTNINTNTNNSNTNNSNTQNNNENINNTTNTANTNSESSEINISNQNNTRLIRNMINLINDIDTNLSNNVDSSRIEQVLYTFIDSSGNTTTNTSDSIDTLNVLNNLWNRYRNI